MTVWLRELSILLLKSMLPEQPFVHWLAILDAGDLRRLIFIELEDAGLILKEQIGWCEQKIEYCNPGY